jgi:carboxypeptidase Q
MKYQAKRVVPAFLFCLLSAGAAFAQETVNWDVVARIREEGFQRSQVMDIVGYMTDVLGPRVTGSRRMRKWDW